MLISDEGCFCASKLIIQTVLMEPHDRKYIIFEIMAQDPEETDVFDCLRKLIVKYGEQKVQKAVSKYFCTYVGFILKTVMYSSL